MPPSLPNNPPWGTFLPVGLRRMWLRILHRIPHGSIWRRIALWLRRPLKNSLGDLVDLNIWGLKLRVRSRGNLSEQRLLFMPQFLDSKERAALARELRNGGVFFDIGANAGVYSLWIASLRYPNVRIEAFEPDPELCALLRFNLEINALDSVSLNEIALGDHEGVVQLTVGDGNKGENRIAQAADENNAGLKVPMTSLPLFLASKSISSVTALKIDVEGHEESVLAPLFAQVDKKYWPSLIVCELVKDGDSKIHKTLVKNGYQLFDRGRLNGIYRLPQSSSSTK